jgi:hypothetical protein
MGPIKHAATFTLDALLGSSEILERDDSEPAYQAQQGLFRAWWGAASTLSRGGSIPE